MRNNGAKGVVGAIKPITYTVNYNANGGSGTMTASTLVWKAQEKLRANTFTRAGYIFAGWSTVNGGTVVSNNPVVGGTLTNEALVSDLKNSVDVKACTLIARSVGINSRTIATRKGYHSRRGVNSNTPRSSISARSYACPCRVS
ncbi:MAG: hypothetical protein MdMp024_1887 [Bacteroidales bacterium]